MEILKGVRIVEFSTAGAGPICARILAEYGADVIIVEDTRAGTSTRGSYLFDFFHMNKRSISVNLKSAEGRQVMEDLIAGADVFLSNFRIKALEKLSLSYEVLHERYPKLIYALLTGYGERGPARDDPGFDVTGFWGRAGVEYTMQDKNALGGIIPPSAVGDICTGTVLCGGILGALYNRERTGLGMKVSTSLLGTGIWVNNNQMVNAQYGVPYPASRLTPSRALMNSYPCKDGYFNLLILNFDRDFPKLLSVIGRSDLIGDSRWTCMKDTEGANSAELREILDEGFSQMTIQETREAFARADLSFGYIQSPQELISDPQVVENQFIEKYQSIYGDREVYYACAPVQMNGESAALPKTGAPRLGEHSAAILRECGYSEEKIAELLQSQAVKA